MGQESSVHYDAVGNISSTTDFNGDTIDYTYDARNRLVVEVYPDGTSVHFTYTATGQVATEVDARGTTSYTYDDHDRLLSRTDPDGTMISYQFDADGNRTSVTTPAGTTVYTFDALNREATVTDPNGGVTRYTYDADGNLTKTLMPNGTEEDRAYDDMNHLVFLEDIGPSGVIASYTYTVEPNGRIDAVAENTGRVVDYSYDALDRLTQEKITDAVFGNETIDYAYDAVGNRLTRDDSAPGQGLTTYTYDADDRLLNATTAGQVTQYTYDNNGNMLSQVSATDAIFYTWDFNNHLSAVTDSNGTIDERYTYDAAGDLVAKIVGGQETRFLIDTVQPYVQVALEYQPGGQITAVYVYGNRLISQTRGGETSYYVVDAQGNTRELTNASGHVTDLYIYDAFGNLLVSQGTTVNTHLFLGEQSDPSSGLIYLRARFLAPALGRFVSRDPFPGITLQPMTLQHYIYADANPVNTTDPTGLLDLEGATAAQAIQAVLIEVGAIVGGRIGYAKGGLLGLIEGAVLGAAIGAFLGYVFLPAGTLTGLFSAAPPQERWPLRSPMHSSPQKQGRRGHGGKDRSAADFQGGSFLSGRWKVLLHRPVSRVRQDFQRRQKPT